MHDEKVNRCDDRIVSIHQPWVRPIIRGKQNKSVEFGAKINVSLDGDRVANVDHVRWDAFNEGQDVIDQVEAYKTRAGSYPEVVMVSYLWYSSQQGVPEGQGDTLWREAIGTATQRDSRERRGAESREETNTDGLSATDTNRREIWSEQSGISIKRNTSQAIRYISSVG